MDKKCDEKKVARTLVDRDLDEEKEPETCRFNLFEKLKKVKLVGYVAVALIISGLTVLSLKHPSLTIGVVDIQKLITNQAQYLASHYPKGQVPKEKLREAVEDLKETLDTWAYSHKTILIARRAVWGGPVPDYTESFTNLLQKGRGQ